jgi:hypothetical protein
MKFSPIKSLEILERTPDVLDALLRDISDTWSNTNEGGESWSARDIVGHLIHGERTDWKQRLDIILSDKPGLKFQPFDRFAQFEQSKGKTMSMLLDEFRELRTMNAAYLKSLKLLGADFDKKGIHPDFGPVTLSQLISTWVVHDLNHIAQISRVMAKQYKEEVGPWIEYLRILKS